MRCCHTSQVEYDPDAAGSRSYPRVRTGYGIAPPGGSAWRSGTPVGTLAGRTESDHVVWSHQHQQRGEATVSKGRPGARVRIDPDLWARYAVVAKAAGHPDRSSAVREFIEREVRAYDQAQHFALKAR